MQGPFFDSKWVAQGESQLFSSGFGEPEPASQANELVRT